MVSTRGLKFKFGEGERVLCYEPDPTKAKVLYESKVLEVCVSKDGKGKKIPEYLIHFNGWSSTWDRCVTEEFVLKDNDDNRGLQKRLAEAAALNLIHPIRKKSKKKKKRRFSDVIKDSLSLTTATSSSKKRVSVTTEDEESEDNNNWRDRRVSGGLGGGSHSGAESNASHCSSSTADGSEEDEDVKQMDLELPDVLKRKLEEVHNLIKQKNKLLSLPSNPNVISILEGYVKNYSANAFCITPEKPKAMRNQMQTEKNISLCKEVMDGMRIYFDFTLPTLLLYEEERAQYAHWVKNFKPPVVIKEEVKQPVSIKPNKQNENECETCSDLTSTKVKASQSNEELSSQSVKPQKLVKRVEPSEVTTTSEVGYPRRVLRSTAGRLEISAKMSPSRPPYDSQPQLFLSDEEQHGTVSNKSKECKTTKCSRSQKQRSNCKIQIASSPSSPPQVSAGSSPPSLSAVDSSSPPSRRKHPPPLVVSTHMSSSSSSRSGPTTPTASVNHPNPPHMPSDVSSMIDRTIAWKMIPDSVYHQVPPPPSLIYGAHHLTRLFVKMPEMLTRTNISDYKLSTIHGHLELFLKYLADCQEELFMGEEIANDYKPVDVVTIPVPSSQM